MGSLADSIKSIFRRKSSKRRPEDAHQHQEHQEHLEHAEDQIEHHPVHEPEQQLIRNDSVMPATSTGELLLHLRNDTGTSPVYAYVTGTAIDNNALFLLSADGTTPYYPSNPSDIGTKVAQNISINLGAPGNIVIARIPFVAGGRIWFSVGKPLVFALNPGPALVEPSVFNDSDPNVDTNFSFMEFTFNNSQVFANLSYVDFVGAPIAMTLRDTDNVTQHVSGMPADGLQRIANGLRAQTARDGRRWSSLIVNHRNGRLLRILSPNSGILLNPTWFESYWTDYVDHVYSHYSSQQLTVDTQAGYGNVTGEANADILNFGSGGTFVKPTAADIFSCASGPFATGANDETNVIIPRLAAAFNRSTLFQTNNQPNGVKAGDYYKHQITNHYARIVHAANLDGHGYAFPYDDVTPDGGVPQEGAVFSYSPADLHVAVGGVNAFVP